MIYHREDSIKAINEKEAENQNRIEEIKNLIQQFPSQSQQVTELQLALVQIYEMILPMTLSNQEE